MKKLFLAMMACLLVTSSAYAFETSITGGYFVRGSMYDFSGTNDGLMTSAGSAQVNDVTTVTPDGTFTTPGTAAVAATYLKDQEVAVYDQDLDIKVKINTDENTFLAFAIEARDGNIVDGRTDTDEAFHCDYVYIQHTFGTGTTVAAGDMNGPLSWGTVFGSYADTNGFALQITQEMSFGSLVFLTEKSDENAAKLGEGDVDWYAVGAVVNMGDMSIMPRLAYAVNDTAADADVIRFDVAFNGTFGDLTVESEFIYEGQDAAAADYDLFGIYAKASYDFGFMNAAILGAYASVDGTNDVAGLSMGDDFEPLLIPSNKIDGDFADLTGMSIVAVAVSAPVTDELTVKATLGYIFDNKDASVRDIEAFEIDLGASYKITDALVYSVNFAYLDAQNDTVNADADGFYVDNVLTLSF